MNDFYRTMPMRLKDKLLAYAVVLALKLNSYVINVNSFASSTKTPMTRYVNVKKYLC